MKVKRLFNITLAGLVAAAIIPTGAIFAAADDSSTDASTFYPQNFEHDLKDLFTEKGESGEYTTVLHDYAVSGDSVAFAYNTTVTVISYDEAGDRQRNDLTHGSSISRLDFKDGVLYFEDALNEVYVYSPELASSSDYNSFKPLDSAYESLNDDNSVFYTLEKTSGELSYWNGGTRTDVGAGYSVMKKYDGVIYCIKDNLPCKIVGDKSEALPLNYTDFKGADTIKVGDTAKNLKADNYTVKMARLESGKYFTQIDPTKLNGNFVQISTKKLDGEMTCLILCESGNASVFATKDGIFVTATENLHEEVYTAPPNDWKVNSHGERAAYSVVDVGVYASPYMSDCTRIATLKSGSDHPVKVLEKVEKRVLNFLSTDFYRVEYRTEEVSESGEKITKTVSGFVAANFLTEYDFKAEDNIPAETGTDDFKYDTNVTSVVLVVIVVALVLIAILYLTLISTNKKAKKKKKKAKKNKDEDDEQQSNSDDSTEE